LNTLGLLTSAREEADDKATPPLWTDATLVGYAAEAEMEAARRARLLKDATTAAVCTYTVAQGDQSITLDPRVMFIRSCKIASKSLPLGRIHDADMNRIVPDWDVTDQMGDVTRFIPDKETGKIWFDGPFQAADTVKLVVVREPLSALALATISVGAYFTLNEGGLGVLTTTYNVAGTAGNSLAYAVVGTTGAGHENRSASVAWNGTTLTITLGTDNVGAYDATKNTFDAIAALINVVTGAPFTSVNSSDTSDHVTGTSSGAFAHGSATSGTAVNPEIPARYHYGLVNWMLFRMFNKQDAQTNDPEKAAKAEAAFEKEFGKKSSAIDERYIQENYGFDEFDGVF